MGNCLCRWEPSVYRVSSNAKSESPKDRSPSEKQRRDDSKLPSNPKEVEDLRRDSAANPLIAFTFEELKIITGNFRQDGVLGGGGFGSVYKGLISEDLREGLQPLAVAVKVHDGHLTPRSDVYSFGVVLLELLTGRKSLDKSRPAREQNLTDWALPLLKEKKKLLNIIDPRLQGDYPIRGVHKAAMLAYHCLNRNPKARPLMRDIVDSLEPLQGSDEVPTDKTVITVITEVPKEELNNEGHSHCN
ncbi:Serine-threonine/tyrosine-protein kinase [Theobroma cacao]|nr:Serine-threonine/tyrosine-protein kinase [Theobroma cacao]